MSINQAASMNAFDIARRLAELNQVSEACQAYKLVLYDRIGADPEVELEAAIYLFQNSAEYEISYNRFCDLYNRGHFKADLLPIITQAFYDPNRKMLEKRYEKNCKLLSKYPYIFRKDFLPFEELPVRFYPFDDKGYLPFDIKQDHFDAYINFNDPVITRNFFKNLDNPILATDVYSQYELEYLCDNVRKSEWVARDNHIYLHYTDWAVFCAHLQCLNLRPLLEDKKIVFLIGEEIAQYPIDFKARFGLDYSQYTIRRFSVDEVTRLIWHTQLSTHNGGDFFNEIFDGHPNLLCLTSMMLDGLEDMAVKARKEILEGKRDYYLVRDEGRIQFDIGPYLQQKRRHWSDKDFLVAYFLAAADRFGTLDYSSRIAPVLFFQPHFGNIYYKIVVKKNKDATLTSKQFDHISNSSLISGFKYIKTFTPMRRFTTSYGGTVRYTGRKVKLLEEGLFYEPNPQFGDTLTTRILNRSYMIDPQHRLLRDSVLVRFEDGKLNPTATFTALAEFLDIPYTQSMTYCSEFGKKDPLAFETNVRGFDPATVYRTYDEYAGDAERCLLEYMMRDAYREYGYDFQYYDGKELTEQQIQELVKNCTTLYDYVRRSWRALEKSILENLSEDATQEEKEAAMVEAERYSAENCEKQIQKNVKNCIKIIGLFNRKRRFVNANDEPLRMMPMLKLDPDLLEQPLYR